MRQRIMQWTTLAAVLIAVMGWEGCAHQVMPGAPEPPAVAEPGPPLSAPEVPEPIPAPMGAAPLPGPSLKAQELQLPPPPPRWAPGPFPETANLLAAAEGTRVVLLLGADDRPGLAGRSDSMVLAAVDTRGDRVRLLSLPRDGWAYLPGRGWDKWNHAYAYGGEALARQTLQRMLGIRIDHTVVINFQGFAKIVDALGGVDVVVDHDLVYDDPWDVPPLHINIKAGAQHLDGEHAVQFARFRNDTQSDWGRIHRQQQLAEAMLRAALRPQVLPRLPALATSLAAAYRTDLSVSDRLRYALLLTRLKKDSLPTDTIKGTDRLIPTVLSDGNSADVWYTFLDLEMARQKAAWLVLGRTAPAAFRDEARRLNTVYRQAEPPRN